MTPESESAPAKRGTFDTITNITPTATPDHEGRRGRS